MTIRGVRSGLGYSRGIRRSSRAEGNLVARTTETQIVLDNDMTVPTLTFLMSTCCIDQASTRPDPSTMCVKETYRTVPVTRCSRAVAASYLYSAGRDAKREVSLQAAHAWRGNHQCLQEVSMRAPDASAGSERPVFTGLEVGEPEGPSVRDPTGTPVAGRVPRRRHRGVRRLLSQTWWWLSESRLLAASKCVAGNRMCCVTWQSLADRCDAATATRAATATAGWPARPARPRAPEGGRSVEGPARSRSSGTDMVSAELSFAGCRR